MNVHARPLWSARRRPGFFWSRSWSKKELELELFRISSRAPVSRPRDGLWLHQSFNVGRQLVDPEMVKFKVGISFKRLQVIFFS